MNVEKKELRGKIVRWVSKCGWGIVNFYPEGGTNDAPHKAFFHISKLIGVEQPQLGSRVSFELGPARSASELPQALNVEVIFTPAVQ